MQVVKDLELSSRHLRPHPLANERGILVVALLGAVEVGAGWLEIAISLYLGMTSVQVEIEEIILGGDNTLPYSFLVILGLLYPVPVLSCLSLRFNEECFSLSHPSQACCMPN